MARRAWHYSVLLHGIGIVIALLIPLQDPPMIHRSVEIVLEEWEHRFQEGNAREMVEKDNDSPRPVSRKAVQSFIPPDIPPLPDIEIRAQNQPAPSTTSLPIDKGPLEKHLTPEEAFGQLTRLLEEYPQYREMIVREMIAGSGFVPDSLPPIDLHLETMIGDRFRDTWIRSREHIEHEFRSYDGVHGWRQNSNYGGQLNIFGLLQFLIDLIEGR